MGTILAIIELIIIILAFYFICFIIKTAEQASGEKKYKQYVKDMKEKGLM